MPSSETDFHWLEAALAAARPWRGRVAPNPAVGAVVVRGERLLAAGVHRGPGRPHAEPDALDRAGDTKGSTLYVTLEPCNHHGRTPPCTDRILSAGVARVVYGHRDANPEVAGHGAERLRAAGVSVDHVPVPAVAAFYRSFDRALLERLPTVTAKLAVDRNGRYAGRGPERYLITGEEANEATHRWRERHDAILTTAETLLADDPRLDVRLPGRTPRALPIYVWDRRARLETDRRCFATAASITVFHGADAAPDRLRALERRGVRLAPLADEDPFRSALTRIVANGHHHVWAEAGGRFVRALAETSYLQRLVLYLGAKAPAAAEGPVFTLSLPTARLSEQARFLLGPDTATCYWTPGDESPERDLEPAE